ncbi:MAG: cell division protein FtsL [Lactobacillales bacterium]|jgi:cell division protein FtsL|nr:cell division protein FtsL [Lactobacillales bacterium]
MAGAEPYLAIEEYEYEEVDAPKRGASDPQFPKKNIIRLSKVEKIVYCVIILVAIIFAFAIVYSITTVQSTNHESAQLKAENDRMKDKVGELRQKVSELSKADRVKSIAKKKGLSVNDERVKKTD